MIEAALLNPNCIICNARVCADSVTDPPVKAAERAAAATLAALLDTGLSADDAFRQLCFVHRRRLGDALKRMPDD